MRSNLAIAGFGAIALSLCAVSPTLGGGLLESCSVELQENCANVEPGNGHLYACLYANEEKLSDACAEATSDVHDQLDLFFELVRYTKQECLVDIQTHCAGTEMGGGRIYSCLKENKAELSDACGEVMSRLSLPKD